MSVSASKNWEVYREEFFRECDRIYKQRGGQYNRDTDIRSYWIYGISSIFHAIWSKANRLRSILRDPVIHINGPELDAFNDSLIDLVNYASFCYAENQCRL